MPSLTADAGIVATARYLIRMCELLPDVCDRAEISLDIDRLLIKLPYYPVAGFTDGLRRTLARAREQGILPFTPLSDAAAKAPTPSAQTDAIEATVAEAVAQLPGLNPFPWHDPVQIAASEVGHLGGGEAMSLPALPAVPNVPRADSVAWADEFDLAAWFPSTSTSAECAELTADDTVAAPLPLDFTALDVDMANWFPAAPHVWFQDQ